MNLEQKPISLEDLNVNSEFTARELMAAWDYLVCERYQEGIKNIARVSKLIPDESIEELTRLIEGHGENIYTARTEDELSIDSLTGALYQRDFFKFLELSKRLGKKDISVAVCDLNFLKDYNDKLGQPIGGDYALALSSLVAKIVAYNHGYIIVRYQQAGGDDFLIAGYPKSEEETTDIIREIKQKLYSVDPEQFYANAIPGLDVVRSKTNTRLALPSDKVEQLKSKPDLARILVPPSFTFDSFRINTDENITEKNGKYDFKLVDSRIKSAQEKITGQKNLLMNELLVSNNLGASQLARK